MALPIEIKNLTKTFGNELAVNNLSFSVHQGEVFAFLGSNGSGKTTTIRCLLQIYKANSGSALVNGKVYDQSQRSKIGYLPEERGLYTRAKVFDVLLYFTNLRGFSTKDAKKKIDLYLERTALTEHKNKNIAQLSSGMQQKVQLGLALLHEPDILILDEPFKGLDPVNRELFTEILKETNEKNGTSILYSSHVIEEVQKLADSLIIIKNGKSKAYGSVNEVRRQFGSKTIQIQFTGKPPAPSDKFELKINGKFAEISPKEKATANDILSELLAKGTDIIEYKLDYPTLNKIFIDVVKNEN